MTSFDDGLKFSDHRALCIDLNESALFHVKSKDATARKNCGLSSKNKEQVKAYLEIVHAQFLAHNIYARCLKLTEMGLSQGVHALQKGADHLDHQVTIIVLQAERKTTRKKLDMDGLRNWLRREVLSTGSTSCNSNVATYIQKFWHTEPEEGTEILPNKLDDAWTKLTLVQDNAKAHKKEFLNKKCEFLNKNLRWHQHL